MKNILKRGFSLVELIFSILILSIVMFMFLNIYQSAIISNTSFSSNKNILNLETFLITILKRSYDENNTLSTNWKKSLVNNGDNELQIYRIGKKEINNNKFRKGDGVTSETPWNKLGVDKGENPNDQATFNDIDDYNNYTLKYNDNGVYKDVIIDGYKFNSYVYYTNDSSNYSDNNNTITFNYEKLKKNTNIKTIKVVANNQNLDKKIVFYYNSANIGGSHLYRLSEISK